MSTPPAVTPASRSAPASSSISTTAGRASAGVQAVRKLVANGQTIIISQSADSLGNTRNTITTGGVVYPFDADSIDTLPPELRELARNTLSQSGAPRTTATKPRANPGGSAATPATLEERIHALEEQNRVLETQSRALQDQLQALRNLIEKQQQGTPPGETAPQK